MGHNYPKERWQPARSQLHGREKNTPIYATHVVEDFQPGAKGH
jgi:hypothetical protein